MSIPILLVLIPLMPLLAAAVTAALGKRVLGNQSHWPTVVAFVVSCAASVMLVFAVKADSRHEGMVTLWTWASVEDAAPGTQYSVLSTQQSPAANPPSPISHPQSPIPFRIDITLRADPLTAIMLSMVTFISLLVAVYAIGYMHGDSGYWRFFSYVSLFVFSMTMLVSVSNFVLLYVFWEAVGLCSYLLIGFWLQKPEASAAGMKAFLVNRIGDFGFALGIFLLWTTYGTLNFHDTQQQGLGTSVPSSAAQLGTEVPSPTVVPGILGETRLHNPSMYVGGGVATAICLLLMLGACGKSAQFPLHVWLPDAMEGPTPVSALIHAATMVTAGVYMVARCSPLFAASQDAQQVVAVIGGGTAILAAVIALTQNDLKRILAYSTVSQLGYMFLGLGTGTLLGVTSGMFHLVTHAFFKALLFLGAGSVMHAMGGVIDIRQFGGLRHRMPKTHLTFLIGCLALAGIVPFAGFWSKDAIIAAVKERSQEGGGAGLYELLYLVALVTAFLTAFYTFRAFFLTFYGEERIPKEAGHHAHESPPAMTGPLMILALGALGVGAYFQWTGDFLGKEGFLVETPVIAYLDAGTAEAVGAHSGSHMAVAITSTIVAVAGIVLAAILYLGRGALLSPLAGLMKGLGLYGLSYGKFFFDEIYVALVVWPLEAIAGLSAWIDQYMIDGLVNAVGAVPRVVGAMFRPLQGGMVQFYALVMALGMLAMVGALLL